MMGYWIKVLKTTTSTQSFFDRVPVGVQEHPHNLMGVFFYSFTRSKGERSSPKLIPLE